MNVPEPSRREHPPRVAALGALTVACAVMVAASPWLTWLTPTGSTTVASGFDLVANRAELGIHGNALVLGFAADGAYHSLLGPVVPLIVGLALVVAGGVLMLRQPRLARAWIAPVGAAVALCSVGAAGLTGGSGVEPGTEIGGLGIRAWALGSAVAALALGVVTATDPPPPGRSAFWRTVIEWAALPAIPLGGACAELLHAVEERQPFAAGAVFVAAASTAAFPAAGTVAALVAVAPGARPLPVTLANGAVLVVGTLLFFLWFQVALA
jgi:hypothetical protein